MEYFKKYFDIDEDQQDSKGEVKVLCPFHDDTNPSASVNLKKDVFKCWVCGEGHDEAQFISKVEDIPLSEAYRKKAELDEGATSNWETMNVPLLWINDHILAELDKLNITKEVVEELLLGVTTVFNKQFLGIPIIIDGDVKEVISYNILKHKGLSKVYAPEDSDSGYIFPYDAWKKSDETTYICEGEKDALVARSLGLNAICITGGASSLPQNVFLRDFAGRDVVIVYDNDDAGKIGCSKLGTLLASYAKDVKAIHIGEVVEDKKGGDVSDYVNEFGGTLFDFLLLPLHEIETRESVLDWKPIKDAIAENIFRKKMQANVTVSGELSDAFIIPTTIIARKMEEGESRGAINNLNVGQVVQWSLKEHSLNQMLPLIEVDAKDKNLKSVFYSYLGLDPKEYGVQISKKSQKAVYKVFVSDAVITKTNPTMEVYSFEKLEVGKNYSVTYVLYPHPNKNQKIVAIVTEAIALSDVSDYKYDEDLMKPFRIKGTVEDRVKYLYELTKYHVKPHMNFDIWFLTDLTFNSILDFDYGGLMKGALDVFILGDTQVGKTETTSMMRDMYDFGHFLSLKTATVVGLIGGSTKQSNDTYTNTLGALPRQNGGLVIQEEFSGAPQGYISKLTDIRTSNVVRIARASGELVAECKLRMITLSNPLAEDFGGGTKTRPLNSFPNGAVPIMELIRSAEDVARYDLFLLVPKVVNKVNPFKNKKKEVVKEVPVENFRHKIKWAITRKPEHVLFDEGVESYIWEKGEELNSMFECDIPIFGTTTAKKLAKMSVALASLILNHKEDDVETVFVTKEIVDYVSSWFEKVYKAEYFRLDKVKKEYDSYSQYSDVELLQLYRMYETNAVLIEALANTSSTTQANLQALSGMPRDNFSVVFNNLARLKAVILRGSNVYPSEKFRRMYREIVKGNVLADEISSEENEIEVDVAEDILDLDKIVRGE